MKRINLSILLAAAMFAGCTQPSEKPSSDNPPASSQADETAETKELRIIATSDLHGKFAPWDYALNEESLSGSMEQLQTAVSAYSTDNMLLVDAGDTIQDNASDIFLNEEVHPMIQAINAIGYDVWTVGNHEFNYGMDKLRQVIGTVRASVLCGNVIDENGDPVSEGYVIFDKDGLRVAVIGMVTPNITHWDSYNLRDCTVNDPLAETRKILDAIEGRYDVLIGVFHMGIENEYNTENSGVTDICNACPEFDVMISSHEHQTIESMDINGVLVIQNTSMAKTMSVIDLQCEKDGDGWKPVSKAAETVDVSQYEPDAALKQLLDPYDMYAREDAETVIGTLEGGPLAPENEIKGIPTAQLEDTALIDLINNVQLYYSGAKVSGTPLFTMDANMQPGKIRKCDTSLIYKYTNTLYTVRMTGAQMKKFMEWSVSYYNTFVPGDLTISFNENIRLYNYHIIEGVNYDINIANEPGNRIENLTWPDGTPVKDDEEFEFATNNYAAGTYMFSPGIIYEADDMPVLTGIDVRGDIGGVRELIRDYIVNVKGGVITPECNHNWKLTGYEWDEELHNKAVEQCAAGILEIPTSEDGRNTNVRAIREEDLK